MKNEKLQRANAYLIERFAPWLTHMLTLDLIEEKTTIYSKHYGWAKGAVERKETSLTEASATSSLRYFLEVLNYQVHGRRTRKKRYKDVCRILAIPILEGNKGNKRRHFHVLLGNIPPNKLDGLQQIVENTWGQVKWGMPSVKVRPVHDADGAAFYVAKEVGYINDDAVLWEQASIPNRLIGKSA